ncbi:MAG: hypothetical protein M1431_03955 [Candidatus Thermoplasmatota archaeon]|nr:hypothetical protein [Candidatus Thermoplasmatota archaeon]
MSDRISIAVSKEKLNELYSVKFDFRVNTIEEAIKELLNKYHQKQDIPT